jgi:hypothetical protein
MSQAGLVGDDRTASARLGTAEDGCARRDCAKANNDESRVIEDCAALGVSAGYRNIRLAGHKIALPEKSQAMNRQNVTKLDDAAEARKQ